VRLVLVVLGLVAIGCGAGAPSADSTSRVLSASPSPTPSAAIAQGDVMTITVSKSTVVTVRVREQLARLPAPSDAVLSTSAASGRLLLLPDGSFATGSKVDVDMTTLASDQRQRDDFVKRSTLQTSRYPTASFVPTKVENLPAPLPSSGEWKVTLVGDLTIRGVTKQIAWDATVKRDGGDITATATTNFKFGDFGMEPPSAPVVLSVVDDVRLQIDFVGGVG
jgi:polyisoprenoid-binding protein YceI